jgi:L-2,4-diaminobutyric acid acetyltransferase
LHDYQDTISGASTQEERYKMNKDIIFRPPTSSDAAAMHNLARDSQILSVNSIYSYALMARYFHKTCLVAEYQGNVCGYITGFSPPEQPKTLFVWQIGIAKPMQKQGLGKEMLITLVKAKQPVFLEATIDPENQASINLFKSVAKYFAADHTYFTTPFFDTNDLHDGEHVEHLMNIGPFVNFKTN